MDQPVVTMSQQIARAASTFEQQRTGHAPTGVTVVLSEDTLVITLRGGLSEVEKALAQCREGAAQVQGFHRLLFTSSADSLWREITRITGSEVREATAEVDSATGTVLHRCLNCINDTIPIKPMPANNNTLLRLGFLSIVFETVA